MRQSSFTRGWRTRNWDGSQPRTPDGRFSFTDDVPKATNSRSTRSVDPTRRQARSIARLGQRLLSDAKDQRDIQLARRQILDELSPKQRRKLLGVILSTKDDKDKANVVSALADQPSPRKQRKLASDEGKVKAVREKKNKLVSESSLTVKDDRVQIWKDGKQRYKDGFRVVKEKGYEYKPGGITLNRSDVVIKHDGETIMGIQPSYTNPRSMTNERLTRELAQRMTYVESGKSPAPYWSAKRHGGVARENLAKEGYGKIQIHHINQWTPGDAINVTNRKLASGEIDLETAKSEMSKVLNPIKRTTKSGKEVDSYEIKVTDKPNRRLVLLAGGTHDIYAPKHMYEANHPLAIHPKTGKPFKVGIPEEGDSGRKAFGTWRNKFWREYYRRESHILSAELSRRLKNKELTPSQVTELWKNAREKVDKMEKHKLKYKSKSSDE